MITKIIYIITLAMALLFALPAVASAANPNDACSDVANRISASANDAAGGPNRSDCGSRTGTGNSAITRIARGLVTTFSIIVGIVAIIMIIYGGFRYIVSAGDSSRVGNAKNILIYAIVGLIVVALAQIIVRFVLTQSATLTTPCPTNKQILESDRACRKR